MANQTTEKLIHVFRAGVHTTAAGERIEFTQADLEAAAAAYDPGVHEAPLVIGHPKSDAPAYGWAKGLRSKGGDLFVVADQVNPEFAQMVNDGAFKKRSLKWFRPTDPLNPRPGVWYPQHVGFLGAVPPAIKGLQPVQFSEGGDLVEVEFGQYEDRVIARLFRRLREWLIAQHGQETADRVIDGYDVDALAEEAVRDEQEDAVAPAPISAPVFSQSDSQPDTQEVSVSPEEKAALEAENAALKAQLRAHEEQQAEATAASRRAFAVEFCEGLIGEGKVLPAEKDGVVELLVIASSASPVEFSQGDTTVTEVPLQRLEGLLKALPKRVEFGEVAKPDRASKAVEFAAADGLAVDTERLDLHAKAVSYQQAHPGTDYLAAIKAVS